MGYKSNINMKTRSDIIRGIQIDTDGWKVANLDKDGFRTIIGAEEVDTLTVEVRGKNYRCMCDHDGYAKGLPLSAMSRKGKHLRSIQHRALVHGPLFLYLDSGLTDYDIIRIGERIQTNRKYTALEAEGVIAEA